MNKIFDTDNKFNRVMTTIFDLMLLNILTIIGSLPIFTFGASFSALYSVTLKMVDNIEGGIWKSFWKEYKSCFVQKAKISLIFLIVAGVLVFDMHIMGQSQNSFFKITYGFCITLITLLVAVYSYVIPLMAKFNNTLGMFLMNAIRLVIAYPLVSVLIVFLNILPVIGVLFLPAFFARIAWLWLVIAISTIAYVNSFFLNKIFEKLINDEE